MRQLTRMTFRTMLRVVGGLVIAAGMFSSTAALAQGTSGTLPDPIASAELARYAQRLNLSEEQMRAVEALHDQYREEFRQLREGEISRFMVRMRELQGGGMRMPERSRLEAFFEDWQKIFGQIKQVDERFLATIATVLTDQQQPRLQRVIMARDRQRHTAGQMTMGMAGPPLDLSELILEVALSAGERDLIDPVLMGYESRLTRLVREIAERNRTMFTELYDAFEEAGLDENAAEDPEQMRRMMEVMQEAFQRISEKTTEKAREVRVLNRQTIDQILPMLSDGAGRRVRDRYVQRAYPQAAFALRSETLELCDMALERDDLPPAMRNEIQSIRISHRAKLDAMLKEAIELAEKQAEFNPFNPDREQMRDVMTAIGELATRTGELEAEANAAVRSVLGEEIWPDLEQRRAARADQVENDATARWSPGGGVAVAADEDDRGNEETTSRGPADDDYLPGPITAYDIAIYADVLELSADERALLGDLHQQYLQRFESSTAELAEELGKAHAARWQFDAETGQAAGGGEEAVRRVFEFRRNALDVIREVDESFMRDIELTLFAGEPSPQLALVRGLRDAHTFSRSGAGMFTVGPRRASPTNLFSLVREQRLSDAAQAKAQPKLRAYVEHLAASLKALYEVQLESAWQFELWQAEMMRRQVEEEDFNAMAFGMELQERLRDTQKRRAELTREVAHLNERFLAEICDVLSGADAARLQQAYREQVYPNVYRDRSSPEKALAAALNLPDLTSRQRGALAAVAAEFRTKYAELCDRMVEHARPLNERSIISWEPEDWQVFQEHQNALARLRFERNELNARTISRLKGALTSEQIERIGGLPEPAKAGEGPWFME